MKMREEYKEKMRNAIIIPDVPEAKSRGRTGRTRRKDGEILSDSGESVDENRPPASKRSKKEKG